MYKEKLLEIENSSCLSGKSDRIWIGRAHTCNRRQVDAKQHYQQKLKTSTEQWEAAKQSNQLENEGVVIVVFKTVDCVQETLDEIEYVKLKLNNKSSHQKLLMKNWSV